MAKGRHAAHALAMLEKAKGRHRKRSGHRRKGGRHHGGRRRR